MPLSDHEQRVLDQIERGLYADDPKFASTVRATDLRSHLLRRVVRSVVVFVVGIAALLAGVIVPQAWVLGVLGFAMMLVAALRLTSALRALGGGTPAVAAPEVARKKKTSTWSERAEERWRKRWEDRDQ